MKYTNFLDISLNARQLASAARIYIDEIDSFSKINQGNPLNISSIIPLTIPDNVIKEYFAKIIGEPFVEKIGVVNLEICFQVTLYMKANVNQQYFYLKDRD